MADEVTEARRLLTKFGPWFDKYAVGIPRGVMAAIMNHESGGNFGAAGDASLGEVGYFQIAAYVPPLFGLPADARRDPESNVAIAALEYGLEAVKWYQRMPSLVRLGTADSWQLARLAFSVGRGGSYQLGDLAKAAGYLQPGRVMDGIVRYVAANGAPQLGSQSPSKVAARVAYIPQQWKIGEAVDAAGLSEPTIIPNPPAGAYRLPLDVAPFFRKPISGIILLGAAVALVFYLWQRR